MFFAFPSFEIQAFVTDFINIENHDSDPLERGKVLETFRNPIDRPIRRDVTDVSLIYGVQSRKI
jgi:hypothetical protein|tara:strand:+ start:170 stop:361 length:192 start_codon:yes stop_codon:yes gene_type:complete